MDRQRQRIRHNQLEAARPELEQRPFSQRGAEAHPQRPNGSQGRAGVIQRKKHVWSRAQLEQQAQARGALVRSTTSYEKVVKAVAKYEAIAETPETNMPRVELLRAINGFIQDWFDSDERAKEKDGDAEKRSALETLRTQVNTDLQELLNKPMVKEQMQKLGFADYQKAVEHGEMTSDHVRSLVQDALAKLLVARQHGMSWDQTKQALGGDKAVDQLMRNPEFVRGMSPDEQFGHDIDMWMRTFFGSKTPNPAMTGFLKRLFQVLKQGLYASEGGDELKAWDKPLAAALSHGGRVHLKIDPKDWDHKNQFWNWLITGDQFERKGGHKAKSDPQLGLGQRIAGTHGVEYDANGVPEEIGKGQFEARGAEQYDTIFNGHPLLVPLMEWLESQPSKGELTEDEVREQFRVSANDATYLCGVLVQQGFAAPKKEGKIKKNVVAGTYKLKRLKGWKLAKRGNDGPGGIGRKRHFGMNIATGGEGNLDVSGREIKAEGDHGHVYFYYEPPALDGSTWGSMLIGVEGSSPHLFGAKGGYGAKMAGHDPFGAAHDTKGTSSEFAPNGGQKWRDLEKKGATKPADYDGMVMKVTAKILKQAQSDYWDAESGKGGKNALSTEEIYKEILSEAPELAEDTTSKQKLFS